jgi:succinyl-diaminopimelate desuccinylase
VPARGPSKGQPTPKSAPHMSDVYELLKALIACPSVTPDDAGCQKLIGERLKHAGFAVEFMNFGNVDNLWATHGGGSPLICLAGHTDVVPAGPRDAWHSDPFEPVERDGHLFGRGAADMKASVAAMVVALELAAATGHPGTIALLLTSDEEGPGIDGTRRVLDELVSRGLKIDGAIVGEPTSETTFGDTIKSGRRGSMGGRLKVMGVQGHTAYPALAKNALHRLAPAFAELIALDWGPGTTDFPGTTLQVSNLHSGTGAGNVIPGEANVWFNVRFGDDWTSKAIQSRVEELLRSNGIDEPVEWSVSAEPFLTPPGPLRDALSEAVFLETGIVPNPSTAGGTSDARFFAAHGVPVAEFGPLNATIHAANECVAIDCLEPLARIFGAVLGFRF